MLVISRKLFEGILIDGGIRVSLVELKGTKAKLSIDAPQNVRVVREEINDGRPDEVQAWRKEAAELLAEVVDAMDQDVGPIASADRLNLVCDRIRNLLGNQEGSNHGKAA